MIQYSVIYGDIAASLKKVPVVLTEVNIRIPSGMVNSNLTDYPVWVDMSLLPQSFWNNVKSDGGDVRVKTTGGTVIPHDLVWINKSLKRGELYFKASSLLSGSNNDWKITCGDISLSKLSATDPNGRNAVWSSFHRMFHFAENIDRTGSGTTATITNSDTDMLAVAEVLEARRCHQGVEAVGEFLYVFDTDRIFKTDRSGLTIATQPAIAAATGIAGIDHSGDGCYFNGKIYTGIVKSGAPTAAYIAEWDAETLAFIQAFNISAQTSASAASVGYNPADGLLYVCKYGSSATTLDIYGFNPTTGTHTNTITLSVGTANMQGVTFWNGKMYVGNDVRPFSIRRYSLTGTFEKTVWQGMINGEINDNLEGLSHDANGLYALVDPEESSTPNIFYLKPMDDVCKGALQFFGNGSADITVSKFTKWTIGVTSVATRGDASYCYAEYGGGGNGERMVMRNTGVLGIWNTTDSFLTNTEYTMDATFRFHWYHDTTVEREIWFNGLNYGNDPVVITIPAGTGTTLRLGQNLANTEQFTGYINHVYLFDNELPDDWKRAEATNYLRPNYFYRLTESGGGYVFPLQIDIVNPGGETSTTGWTSLFGSLPSIGPNGLTSGAGHFIASANQAYAWWGQTVALPSGLYTDIDTGTLEIELSTYSRGFTDADSGYLLMDFYDGSSVYLGSAHSPTFDNATVKRNSVRVMLPKTTRNVRISFRALRVTGTESSTYIDDFELRVHKPGKVTNLVNLFAMEAGNATGWTVTTGSLGTSTARWGETVLSGGSNLSTVAYRDFSLSSLSASVAAGKVVCHLFGIVSNVNGADLMNMSLQYLDGSNVLLGSPQKYAASPQNPGTGVLTVHTMKAAPTNAASVRVGLEYSRIDGTVLDCGVARLSLLAAVIP